MTLYFSKISSLKNARGFTLIELMIVIVIIGVFTAALANMATQFYLEKRANTMDKRLDEVRMALSRFIADDPGEDDLALDPIRYPCPASLTLVPGDANFAMERCPTSEPPLGEVATMPGVFAVAGANGDTVLVGAVPTSTLSISSRNMLDPYNNRFTYAVSWNLVKEDNAINNPNNKAAVIVEDENDVALPLSPAPFVIVSHGRNGAGSYTSAGVKNGNGCAMDDGGTPGDTSDDTAVTAGDARNCSWQTNNSGTFRMQQAFTMGTGAFYDDEIEFTLSSGDDEGWWRATDDTQMHITHKNEGNILIDPDGTGTMVGIGIDAPTAPFHLRATDGFDPTTFSQKEVALGYMRVPGSGWDVTGMCARDDAVPNGDPGGWRCFGADSNSFLINNTAGDGTAFIVDRNDNVGIGGTNSPQTRLDVQGEVKIGNTGMDCTTEIRGATRYNPGKDIMEYCAADDGSGAAGWMSFGGSGYITCSTGAQVGPASGWHMHTFTAEECGGVLPDSSYAGVATSITGNCGTVDTFYVYSDPPRVNAWCSGTNSSGGGRTYVATYFPKGKTDSNGSGGMGPWKDISNDPAPFDVNCDYRWDRLGSGSPDQTLRAVTVDPDLIEAFYGSQLTDQVLANDKSKRFQRAALTSATWTEYPTKTYGRCPGTGGGGGGTTMTTACGIYNDGAEWTDSCPPGQQGDIGISQTCNAGTVEEVSNDCVAGGMANGQFIPDGTVISCSYGGTQGIPNIHSAQMINGVIHTKVTTADPTAWNSCGTGYIQGNSSCTYSDASGGGLRTIATTMTSSGIEGNEGGAPFNCTKSW